MQALLTVSMWLCRGRPGPICAHCREGAAGDRWRPGGIQLICAHPPPASLSNMAGAVLLLSCPDMRQQHLKTGKCNIMSRIQLSLTGGALNGMQASLQRVEGVSHRQWEDALTVGELKGK